MHEVLAQRLFATGSVLDNHCQQRGRAAFRFPLASLLGLLSVCCLSSESLDGSKSSGSLGAEWEAESGRSPEDSAAEPDVGMEAGVPPEGSRAALPVFLVSVDGMAARFVDSGIAAGELPMFRRLQKEAAWTHNARTVVGSTRTLPNHISMLTGRPAALQSGMAESVPHSYLKNVNTSGDVTLHNAGNSELSYVHSVFDVLHDRGLRTGFFAGKKKFNLLRRSCNEVQGSEDLEGEDHGRNKIDHALIDQEKPTEELVTHMLEHCSHSHVDFVFKHIRDLDKAGHSTGWGSEEYASALRKVDKQLARIRDFLTDSTGANKRGYLMVTSDHGGQGMGHGDPELAEDYTIPFYLWGPDVPAGVDLYDLVDESRVDPRTSQVPFISGIPQPIRNADVANLALALLRIDETVPGSVGTVLWTPPH